MAAPDSSRPHVQLSIITASADPEAHSQPAQDHVNYLQRAQWLRAAVLGANDGLVSVASLMMGVGSVKQDIKAMLLAGFAGLVAGACSMAIGEFVSVCTQRDIEAAQMKRQELTKQVSAVESGEEGGHGQAETVADDEDKEQLPNPGQAAIASALAFSVGAVVPLLAAVFINNHKIRMAVVAVAATVALVVFGGTGAVLGKTPVVKSSARVVVGGWMAMALTFGVTKFIGLGAMQI